MYSEGHKHVADVKLDSTVVFISRILLLQGLLILLPCCYIISQKGGCMCTPLHPPPPPPPPPRLRACTMHASISLYIRFVVHLLQCANSHGRIGVISGSTVNPQSYFLVCQWQEWEATTRTSVRGRVHSLAPFTYMYILTLIWHSCPTMYMYTGCHVLM